MKSVETKRYWTIEEYKEFEDIFSAFGEMMLFAMAHFPATTKSIIIRNFIARSLVMLRGVFQLWDIEDYHDCWILYRCMLDRLFHLNELSVNEKFAAFDDWSFVQQYKMRHKIRSDSDFNRRLRSEFWIDTPEEKIRIEELNRNKPQWKSPSAEDVASRMKMKPLYDYGYNYASSLVHPRANEGSRDFVILTKLGDESEFADERTILNNSCLIAQCILREGMNASGLIWQDFVTDMLNDFLVFLETGAKDYKTSFARITSEGPEIISMLCVESEETAKP